MTGSAKARTLDLGGFAVAVALSCCFGCGASPQVRPVLVAEVPSPPAESDPEPTNPEPREVPAPARLPSEIPSIVLAVAIDAVGSVFVDGMPTTMHAIAATAWSANTRATISADRRVTYGRVAEVIDALRRAGVTRFGLNVQEPP